MNEYIMLAEDTLSIRKLLELTLKKNNYKIKSFEDGHKLWKYLLEHDSEIPDLIITDVMMPNMTGYQLCQEIRKNEKFKNIIIVMLTARTNLEAQITGYTLGANDYILKPFNIKKLIEKIKHIFENPLQYKLLIKYGKNKSVIFKTTNLENPLKRIYKILLDLTKKIIFIEDDILSMKLFFDNVIKLLISFDKEIIVRIVFQQKTSNQAILKIALEPIENFQKLKNELEKIIKSYSKKYLVKDNFIIFELKAMGADEYITKVNKDIKKEITNVVGQVKSISKTLKKENIILK